MSAVFVFQTLPPPSQHNNSNGSINTIAGHMAPLTAKHPQQTACAGSELKCTPQKIVPLNIGFIQYETELLVLFYEIVNAKKYLAA